MSKHRVYVRVTVLVAALIGSNFAPISLVSAQRVEPNLPVGECVAAYGNSGRIVEIIQNGYRIATDAEPAGTPMVATASDTKSAPCGAPAPAAQAAHPAAQAPFAQAPQQAGAGCPPSSAPAGLAGRDQTFAAVLLSHWDAPADPGSDGAVTSQIETIEVGSPQTPTFMDRRQYAVSEDAPIYPLRVKFTLCKDYRTQANYHSAEENFVCFPAAGGGIECSMSGHTAGLAAPRDWVVRK